MPRQEFNTTCDIFAGPGQAVPMAFKAACECRFVPQTGIAMVGPQSPVRVAWITMKAFQPTGGWQFPPLGFRPSLADRISIPSGGAMQWWVIYVEEVFWRSQPAYYRANVAHLPAPADGPGAPGHGAGPWVQGNASLILGSESTSTQPAGHSLILGSASSIVVPSESGPLFLVNEP